MEKHANNSPTRKHADDVLNGLFISPLEDSESFDRMESDEARILAPLPPKQEQESLALSPQPAESEVPPHNEEATLNQRRFSGQTSATQEQYILRFAGELKSIKQDLLSIKQHFETMKKPQPETPGAAIPQSRATEAQRGLGPSEQPITRDDTKELLEDLRKLLLYLDRLLESLPEEKIEDFANSEYFNLYRHVFEKLGLS